MALPLFALRRTPPLRALPHRGRGLLAAHSSDCIRARPRVRLVSGARPRLASRPRVAETRVEPGCSGTDPDCHEAFRRLFGPRLGARRMTLPAAVARAFYGQRA